MLSRALSLLAPDIVIEYIGTAQLFIASIAPDIPESDLLPPSLTEEI